MGRVKLPSKPKFRGATIPMMISYKWEAEAARITLIVSFLGMTTLLLGSCVFMVPPRAHSLGLYGSQRACFDFVESAYDSSSAPIGQCSVRRRRIPCNVAYNACRVLNAAGVMPPRDNDDDKEEELDKMKMELDQIEVEFSHDHAVCFCCDSCKHL